ncbi:amino acid adenylation domain-containing protein [Pseudonocardia sp. KRD291]|uniref:non-ribosomal peptide synthetase n=1 Tax=Pseudonocardia sp. KRD291 TaxID=2792007 RepID=UPI001C4A6AEB|nr:amino acid adenylation domain-containing protein [Pseudonocardia sp. KRD291]MBW0102228.1 amino acid adenylation domain-containing protein [Pseudonocardia sp. KRD291]
MSSGAVTHRRRIPVGSGSPDTFVDAAGRALAEVARRLDRDLSLAPATPGGVAGTARAVIHTRDAAGGAPGPSVHVRVEPPGRLCVELSAPPGDVWEPAAAGVAEMQAELLGALLADPGVDLAQASATSGATLAAVLGPVAGAGVDHGPYRSVPDRVLAVARATPDVAAVHAADGTLTYGQLAGHAAALGARIRAAAPEGGVLVPVLVADGLALPVSWAAAMIAGVGYVPVDPRWPAQRIAQVLDLLDGPVVLCTDPSTVPAAHRARALPVQITGAADAAGWPSPPGPDAETVVYGVYTSGTTGTPLCALNTHGGLANRLAFMTRWFGEPTRPDVVLQNTRHTYDSAFWQVFWPLTTGGATVVPTAGEHLDLQDTVDLIAAHGVTVVDFVPAVLSALLGLLEQRPATLDRLRSLRHVVVGGEQINPHDVHRLREMLPGLRVSNAYGPSEAAIGMIFHEVLACDGDDVPLGRPIDNCAAVVVDVDGRPLPPGATGEILIGGACVGAGYHGAPRRTEERFVRRRWADPAAGRVLTGRMYRTGDLGRVDAQGRFHFAGRIDHQVKIRGVRIEPGEVETVSLGCAGVRQAVALVVGPDEHRELVLVTTGAACGDEVLAHLRARLPRGSMPQRAVVVGEMPLTGPGKIDRRRLAARVERPAGPVTGPVTEADPVLSVLRTALRRADLAADEDFFAAGGNSLQAVAAAVELSDLFRVDVGVRDMVDHPTAAGLRELVARRRHDRVGVPAPSELAAADLAALTVPAGRALPGTRRNGPVRTVLLTGATGFVGTRLLHELLRSTDLRVICLVRAPDDVRARRRLGAALAAQRLDHTAHATRIGVLAGDLARPGLGLSAARRRSLIEGCDLVLHAGAMVNLVYDYRMQREPNVLGTAEVIRLARAAGGIPLHHVSTLGVLHDHALASARPVPEDVDLASVTPPAGGYSLSKWVAERLVTAAAGDLPVTVLRLGEVMPATDVAVPNPSALTHLLRTAFDRLGEVPRAAIRTDHSPVDTVARAVVAAVRDRTVWGSALHIYRPGSVRVDDPPAPSGAALSDDARPPRVACTRFLADLRAAAAGGDTELGMLLAVVEHRSGGRAGDETSVREVLENLLQDNPARFDRSAGAALERRAGLDPGPGVTGPDPGRGDREPVAAGTRRPGRSGA